MACMFCTRCGGCELGRLSDVKATDGVCLICNTPMTPEDKVCPNCGAPRIEPPAVGKNE